MPIYAYWHRFGKSLLGIVRLSAPVRQPKDSKWVKNLYLRREVAVQRRGVAAIGAESDY